MKYLLDTGIWLWSTSAPEKINEVGHGILETGLNEIYLSSVAVWEVCIKVQLGKLRLSSPPAECIPAFMLKQRLHPLAITQTHALKVYELPPHHGDPFDRMIIAQAIAEDMAILTSDRAFKKYPVELIWCGK